MEKFVTLRRENGEILEPRVHVEPLVNFFSPFVSLIFWRIKQSS